MNLNLITLNCAEYDKYTKRKSPFVVACYTFNYRSNEGDKTLLDQFIVDGRNLANLVNPGAANDGAQARSLERIINNCTAGAMSEYLWKQFLNRHGEVVSETELVEVKTQIDLKILSNNKKIEVRSSFPRNGIDFAICSSGYEFDIIGPYSNGYKPDEIQKDYYIRALFHLAVIGSKRLPSGKIIPVVEKLIDKMKVDGFKAFLTGGATWAMMSDNTISTVKDFIPEDEMSIKRLQEKTNFRVVPFSKALDTNEMYELIIAERA